MGGSWWRIVVLGFCVGLGSWLLSGCSSDGNSGTGLSPDGGLMLDAPGGGEAGTLDGEVVTLDGEVVMHTVDSPPVANAGTDASATEDVAFNLEGSCSDDVSATCTWSKTAGGGACTFTDLGAGAGVIACSSVSSDTIDVTCDTIEAVTVQLSCNDGVNSAVTDTMALDVQAAAGALMPDDPAVYGSIPEGAVYLFRSAYVDCGGGFGTCTDGQTITAVRNYDDPGTKDLACSGGVTWIAAGGPQGDGAARFDGTDDVCSVSTGFDFDEADSTNNPSILVVGAFTATTGDNGAISTLSDSISGSDPFFQVMDVRNNMTTFRVNGTITTPSHNIDVTTEIVADTAWHLFEGHAYEAGMKFLYDGLEYGLTGGTGGVEGTGRWWRSDSGVARQGSARWMLPRSWS